MSPESELFFSDARLDQEEQEGKRTIKNRRSGGSKGERERTMESREKRREKKKVAPGFPDPTAT